MLHKEPTFIEKDGEILPNYRGDINGPRNSSGSPISETDSFIDSDDEDTYEGEVLSPEQLLALELADRAKGEAALEAAFGGTESVETETAQPTEASDGVKMVGPMTEAEYLQALRDERDADRAGTHWGSSPSDYVDRTPVPRQPINPRTGRPTVDSQNANEKRHRDKAWRDRWGK